LERNQALSDLKKELPGLTGLELGRANSLRLINAEIENGLSLGKLEIQSQAIIAVGLEKEIRLREVKGEQDANNLKIAELQRKIDFENRKDAPIDYSRQERVANLQKDQNELKQANTKLENESKTLTRDRNRLEGEYDGIVVKLNANKARTNNIVETYNKNLKDEKKNQKDVNQATQEQIDNVSRLTLAYDKQIAELQSTLDAYKKIGELTKVDIQEPGIVKDIEAINEARKALQLPTLESEFKNIGIEISTVNSKFSIQRDLLENATDDFGKYYESIRKILSEAAQTQGTTEFAETIKKNLNEASQLLQSGQITKGAFDAFKTLTDQYLGFNKVIKDNPLFKPDQLKTFLDLEKDILIATGEYTLELSQQTGQIEKVSKVVTDYTGLQQKQNVLLNEYGKQITENYNKELSLLNLTGKAREDNIKSLLKQGEITKEQATELLSLKKTEEDNKKLNKLIEEIVAARINALKTVTQTIVQEENQIREFLFRVQESQKEGVALSTEAIKQTLLNNLNLVIEFTQKQNKVVIDEKKQEVDQLISLEEQLGVKGIDISKLTREEKLKILKAYLAKEKEEKDAAAEDDKKRGKTTAEDIANALQKFSQLIGQTASLVAQSFSFQLQQLEKESKKALEQVTGDTARSNELRIELEKQYQKEREQLEKRALIKSLQFQLIQAIADTAQAVTANLAIPPLAVAVGILGAVQIGLITEQLNQAQSMAGGGKIRLGAGGIVMGPSHENGGVSFAGGGLNLEGGETIVNKKSSLNYASLLSSINQSGGGQPLVNNASNSLMEERLIQAISKANQQPIRAYVLNSEITSGQAINRRLDELATL
jgi:hypothetical protein